MAESHGDLEKELGAFDPSGLERSSLSLSAMTKMANIMTNNAPGSEDDGVIKIQNHEEKIQHERRPTSDSSQTLPDEVHENVHGHEVPTAYRSKSRAQSTRSSVRQEAVKVPRAERRGLLARFCMMAEVNDPYAYNRSKKWTITFIIALAGAAAPMGSSLVLPALNSISLTFGATKTVTNLSIALYMLSMSIFPLWWSSFSETLGRRTIYIVSFVLFCLFNALAGISTNIGMFIVFRCLSGGAAASVQAVGAGTVADCWEVKERGLAMGIFYLGPLCGPLLAPVIGGALTHGLGWRSTQWFLSIFGAIICVVLIFCLPETLRNQRSLPTALPVESAAQSPPIDDKVSSSQPALVRTVTSQSMQLKSRRYWAMFRRAFLDPLRIVLYIQFPAVACCVYYSTVTFSSLYVLNISIEQTFSHSPYGYSSLIIGLLYLPNSSGYFLASIIGGRWVDKIMRREAKKAGRYDENGKLRFRPEDRMKENAWIGAAMWPCALIWYGWAAQYHLNIAAPMIANFFFGVGSMIIFNMATTMLTEFMPKRASNGVALNNFCRNIFSCVGTIITSPLVDAIGNGWLFTGIAAIALISGFAVISAMKRYGDKWRVGMDERLWRVMGD